VIDEDCSKGMHKAPTVIITLWSVPWHGPLLSVFKLINSHTLLTILVKSVPALETYGNLIQIIQPQLGVEPGLVLLPIQGRHILYTI